MDKELTPIYLNQEEAMLFVAFQKRYAFIELLESLKVFDIKSGSITVNFDSLGAIGSVDIQRHFRA